MQQKLNDFLKTSPSYQAFMASPKPSFKHTTYFDTYDKLFHGYRDKHITFVEIGVLNGGSLFMWRNYFGEAARIIGIDLNPQAKKWEEHGFEIFIGGQEDPDFWVDFFGSVGEIDIVLDDGGHTYLQQIVTAEMVLDKIKDGGLLVVEDTHTSYMEGFGDSRINFMNYVLQTMHRINSRFSSFQPEQTDRRVSSLEVFESVVAFRVDRPQTSMKSEPIWNIPPDPAGAARDFRDEKQRFDQAKRKKIEEIIRASLVINRV